MPQCNLLYYISIRKESMMLYSNKSMIIGSSYTVDSGSECAGGLESLDDFYRLSSSRGSKERGSSRKNTDSGGNTTSGNERDINQHVGKQCRANGNTNANSAAARGSNVTVVTRIIIVKIK
jgi:hypothetical protein